MDSVDHATWRKSTYSGNNGGQCVETADAGSSAAGTGVAVRDTTNRAGGTLIIPAPAWSAFTGSLR